jgi:hypothetical protein
MTTQVSEPTMSPQQCVLKTSNRWLHEDEEFKNVIILHPDGWVDHADFYVKEISKEEFVLKLVKSRFKNDK